MTDKEQKELRAYCALLLKEHGFLFSPDDPVIPALYIIHMEMQSNSRHNKLITSAIEEAASKINSKIFHFNSPGEALKFQIGIAIKWLMGGLLMLTVIGIVIWYWSMVKDVNRARLIIQASDNVGKLVDRVKKTSDGYYFIEFTMAKGDSIQHFKEFQMLNPKTVRIYLDRVRK